MHWDPGGAGGACLQGPLLRAPRPQPCLHPLQVNLGYLCQACTSLLHSRKMLQHCLQVSALHARLPAGPPAGRSGLHLHFLSRSEQKRGWHPLSCHPPSSAAPRRRRPLLLFFQAARC